MRPSDTATVDETQIQDIVHSLAASPNFAQDGICFAACHSGLYRSDDHGITWCSAYDSLNLDVLLPTTAVVVSLDFESTRGVFAGVQGGILRSVDGGTSWELAVLPSPPPLVLCLVVSPNFARDGTLLAGTMEDGVFRSADRGRRWSPWNFGLLDLNTLCMAISRDFVHDETLFVGTESGVFRSTSGGRAWREVNFPMDCAPLLSLALSPDYANDGILFTGTESYGLFYSDDRGRSWARLGEDVIADAVNSIVLSPEFPAQPYVLVLTTEALLISRDGGQSWSDWEPSLATKHGLACVEAPQGLHPDAPLLVGLIGGDVLRI